MSRRLLQIVNGLVGVATVGLGTVQVIFGVRSPLYAAADLPEFPILGWVSVWGLFCCGCCRPSNGEPCCSVLFGCAHSLVASGG
jgi:hypothetical protein